MTHKRWCRNWSFNGSVGFFAVLVGLLMLTQQWVVGHAGPELFAGWQHTAPGTTVFGVLGLVSGILLIALGDLGGSTGTTRKPRPGVPPHRPVTLPMTFEARSALERLQNLMASFRAMPHTLILPEAWAEFEQVSSIHLPSLSQAHREARSTVSAISSDADTMDADYAVALDRMSVTLEQLLAGCKVLGRDRLAVQSRFIQARHPDDVL